MTTSNALATVIANLQAYDQWVQGQFSTLNGQLQTAGQALADANQQIAALKATQGPTVIGFNDFAQRNGTFGVVLSPIVHGKGVDNTVYQ